MNLQPITIRKTQTKIHITGIGRNVQQANNTPTSLFEHTQQYYQDKWASLHMEADDDGQDFAVGITNNQATAISDGSYKSQQGTSCSILRGSNKTIRIVTINRVPGDPDSQSSYRSELAGIAGSILIIQTVCDKYSIKSGSVMIGLEGLVLRDSLLFVPFNNNTSIPTNQIKI